MLLPGLVSVTFRHLPATEIVHLARTAGLRGIEWGGDVHVPAGDVAGAQKVRALTAEAGLAVVSYGSYYRAGQGGSEEFAAVLASARALGAPNIRVWAGTRGSAEITADGRAAIVADLQQIAAAAAAENIAISLEFHSQTLTDTAASAARLLREVDHPNLFTYWQPIHGEQVDDALTGLRELLPWLLHVHVFHWWPDPGVRLPLAEGAGRWQRFLELASTAPRGARYALLEFVAGDDPGRFQEDAHTLGTLLGSA